MHNKLTKIGSKRADAGSTILWLPVVAVTATFLILSFYEISREFVALYKDRVIARKYTEEFNKKLWHLPISAANLAEKHQCRLTSEAAEQATPQQNKPQQNKPQQKKPTVNASLNICFGLTESLTKKSWFGPAEKQLLPRLDWGHLLKQPTLCRPRCLLLPPLLANNRYLGSVEAVSLVCPPTGCLLAASGDIELADRIQLYGPTTIVAGGDIKIPLIANLLTTPLKITVISTMGSVEIGAVQGLVLGEAASFADLTVPETWVTESTFPDLPQLLGITEIFPNTQPLGNEK